MRLTAPIKTLLPRGLLGRSLLIVLVPLIVLQAVAFTFFYGSHLDIVSRRLTGAIAGEVAQTIELLNRFPDEQDWVLRTAWLQFEVPMRLVRGATLPPDTHVNQLGPMDDDLASALASKVHRPFRMDWTTDPRNVLVRVQLAGGGPGGGGAAQAPVRHQHLPVRAVDRRDGGAAVRRRDAVPAHPGPRHQPPGRGRRGIRARARRCADQAGGRGRGAAGRHGLQPDAGPHRPLPGAADGDAGRRVARPAHPADPAAPGAGDAAAARRSCSRTWPT